MKTEFTTELEERLMKRLEDKVRAMLKWDFTDCDDEPARAVAEVKDALDDLTDLRRIVKNSKST